MAIVTVAVAIDHPNPHEMLDQGPGEKPITALEAAGHPQRVFFDGVFQDPLITWPSGDPEGLNRSSFSGAWFELVE